MPGTQAVSSPTSHSGCRHRGDTPPGLCNIWVTQVGKAPPRCGGSAWACWGVGQGGGLGESGAQPDTPAESRPAPPERPPGVQHPFISARPPSTPQRRTANPDLQMGKLGLSEPRWDNQEMAASLSPEACVFPVTGLSPHPAHEAPASDFLALASVLCENGSVTLPSAPAATKPE